MLHANLLEVLHDLLTGGAAGHEKRAGGGEACRRPLVWSRAWIRCVPPQSKVHRISRRHHTTNLLVGYVELEAVGRLDKLRQIDGGVVILVDVIEEVPRLP